MPLAFDTRIDESGGAGRFNCPVQRPALDFTELFTDNQHINRKARRTWVVR